MLIRVGHCDEEKAFLSPSVTSMEPKSTHYTVYEGKSLGEGSHKEKKMLLMCDTIKGPWEEPIGYSLGVSRSTGNSNLLKQLLLVFFLSFFYLMFGLRREGWGVKESRIELS